MKRVDVNLYYIFEIKSRWKVVENSFYIKQYYASSCVIRHAEENVISIDGL